MGTEFLFGFFAGIGFIVLLAIIDSVGKNDKVKK